MNQKNNAILAYTIGLFMMASFAIAQTYNLPDYFSPKDVAEWNIRGGHIASGAFSPSGTASEGALFYDTTIATQPLLYRYTDGSWALAGGSGGVSDEVFEAHVASQVDPHGATMTVSDNMTVGSGTKDAYIKRVGTATLEIASYIRIVDDAATPTWALSSDTTVIWSNPNTASFPLKVYDGSQWYQIPLLNSTESMKIKGRIDMVDEGCFACLDAASTTTITSAGTYYPINGDFTNTPIENFSINASGALQLDSLFPGYFIVRYSASYSVNSGGVTTLLGVFKNGVLVDCSIMGTFEKTANELVHVSGSCVIQMSTGDEVQLVVTNDSAGSVINMQYYTTSIQRFFR